MKPVKQVQGQEKHRADQELLVPHGSNMIDSTMLVGLANAQQNHKNLTLRGSFVERPENCLHVCGAGTRMRIYAEVHLLLPQIGSCSQQHKVLVYLANTARADSASPSRSTRSAKSRWASTQSPVAHQQTGVRRTIPEVVHRGKGFIWGEIVYCVLTQRALVSLPLSYLLLDTRGIQEVGKRGTRLIAWLTALRATGLNPNVVHTDMDFAEVTAASIAFKTNNDKYNHHLCLWHSLRAIDQYITGKMKSKGFDSVDNTRNSTRLTALPRYLYFLSEESDWMQSNGQSKNVPRSKRESCGP
ncbi:hypothetical protein V1509DRAFT_643976 [Lipomyces kononenkoae]